MRRSIAFLTTVLTLLFIASAAGAATISLSPTDGYSMLPGETVSFDAYFNADSDGDTLTGATLSMGYDASELSFVSYETPLGWEEFFGQAQDVTLDSGSFIVNYNQNYPFGGGPIDVAADESISIGTFTFQATENLAADGLSDLWIVDNVSMPNNLKYSSIISFNDSYGEYASQLLSAQGADVAAVPVPAAVWLMGSGLVAVLGLRRKQN